MTEPIEALHWALSAIKWPDRAVTRKTLRALTFAACHDRAPHLWMKGALKRLDKRGHIRRGAFTVEILDRRALTTGSVPLSVSQIELAIRAVLDYAENGENRLLAPRMAVEANTLRAYIGHADEVKSQPLQADSKQ
jgi:hypothetical protein